MISPVRKTSAAVDGMAENWPMIADYPRPRASTPQRPRETSCWPAWLPRGKPGVRPRSAV